MVRIILLLLLLIIIIKAAASEARAAGRGAGGEQDAGRRPVAADEVALACEASFTTCLKLLV